jgi:hypothetical protein
VTVKEVLQAMAEDGRLAEQVLGLLDAAMWDEWDAGIASIPEVGWGPPELAIAARTAVGIAEFNEQEDRKEQL